MTAKKKCSLVKRYKRMHRSWADMKSRCNNPNHPAYKNYGGRGIKVCEEWDNFENFFIWSMNNGYTDELTIDRKDVDGNYEPINCRWTTRSMQSHNQRPKKHSTPFNGICTLVSSKKKTFLGEKKFFEHFGFKVVDSINDYELLALQFDDKETPKFNDNARKMKIDSKDFTIYYSNECPYVEYEVKELTEHAKTKGIKINFIKIDSLEKAKNAPCIINNWANFYNGEFISNTILNANSFDKLLK